MYKFYYTEKSQELFRERYPSLVSISVHDFPANGVFHTHSHNYPELFLCLSGNYSVYQIDNERFSVKQGDLVALNVGVITSASFTVESRVIAIELDNIRLQGLEDNCLIPDNVCPVMDCGQYKDEIKKIFEAIYFDRLRDMPYCREIARLRTIELIYYLYRLHGTAVLPTECKASNFKTAVKDYIDRYYAEDITVQKLSEKFFVSPSHIMHETKKILGMPPINYLISRRIGEAQKYLIYTNKSIEEIAQLVGYENICYFNKLFLKKTGLSAAQFRETCVKSKKLPAEYI